MRYEVVSQLGGERLQLCETRKIAVTIVKDSGDIIREVWFTKKGCIMGEEPKSYIKSCRDIRKDKR